MNQHCSGNRPRKYFMLSAALSPALISPHLPPVLAQTEPGVVTMHVLYHGTIPQSADIDVTRDTDFYGTPVSTQSVTVHHPSGSPRDAVVMIDGLRAPEKERAQIPPMVQVNSPCSFSPHVMAIQTGSPLEIHNLDPVPRDAQIINRVHTFINVAMVVNTRPVGKRVSAPGLYPIQHHVHQFMRGYVMASENPYFGATDTYGGTRISTVPTGTRDISVRHERLGQRRATVNILSNRETAVTFEFHPDSSDNGRRMNM